MVKRIELLAPARDAAAGMAAIACGADAVYIGAARFGAREAAGNSIEDIGKVAEYAHRYYAKVYAALNTLLRDEELEEARRLAWNLAEAGVDGMIVQDVGLLELDLPNLPLIASTQMDNATPEKVKFLEDVGFNRVILARELTLEQIKAIRAATKVELECFVHGALCVGASGQCYMSYAAGGRSGNRGQCAQPCRKRCCLKDGYGKVLVKDKYLLSLKDLALGDELADLIEGGISSFKIEGRLKDLSYVANVTGYYRLKLDAVMKEKGLRAASSGRVTLGFEPALEKTFNRGFTVYGLRGSQEKMSSMDTPKSLGEWAGTVQRMERDGFVLDGAVALHNGDGLCFFDESGELNGTVVNGVEGSRVKVQKLEGLRLGTKIYRNHDHDFVKLLERLPAVRKVALAIELRETDRGMALWGRDEDGSEALYEKAMTKEPARNEEQAKEMTRRQLEKWGNTLFEMSALTIATKGVYHFTPAVLNELRRGLAEALMAAREERRPRDEAARIEKATAPYPQKRLDYRGNVLNAKARAFYARHGVEAMKPAAEAGINLRGQMVMRTKYCLRRELGWCAGKEGQAEPLYVEDEEGRRYELRFRCRAEEGCGMNLYAQ